MGNELKMYMAPEQALLARSQHGFSVKGRFWLIADCRHLQLWDGFRWQGFYPDSWVEGR